MCKGGKKGPREASPKEYRASHLEGEGDCWAKVLAICEGLEYTAIILPRYIFIKN